MTIRQRAAEKIRQIRAEVRAGHCDIANNRFNTLVGLVGRRGQADDAGVKPKTVARLWGLTQSCFRKPNWWKYRR